LKKILIIGATSCIAENCARLWAARGEHIFLVGRNQEQLKTIQNDLKVRGASKVGVYTMDANDHRAHEKMLDKAEIELEGIDTVLIAYGTLSDQKSCEQSLELSFKEINTNALSVIALLTILANRLEVKSNGTIAIISSVAGDRGRSSNYVYGSAKAMITTFASGLRQRLHKSNISVLTIKPGFIDTPMTKEYQKGLLWAKPSVVAKTIVRAIDNRESEIYVPFFWRFIMITIKLLPNYIFNRLSL
jgi:hypothetical protein